MTKYLSLLAVLFATLPLAAHAILVKSTPAAHGTLGCPTDVNLTFNSRIDPVRSQIILISPDHSRQKLQLTAAEKASDHLAAHLNQLKPGAYELDWQVLAVDGHITRGLIPFNVQ